MKILIQRQCQLMVLYYGTAAQVVAEAAELVKKYTLPDIIGQAILANPQLTQQLTSVERQKVWQTVEEMMLRCIISSFDDHWQHYVGQHDHYLNQKPAWTSTIKADIRLLGGKYGEQQIIRSAYRNALEILSDDIRDIYAAAREESVRPLFTKPEPVQRMVHDHDKIRLLAITAISRQARQIVHSLRRWGNPELTAQEYVFWFRGIKAENSIQAYRAGFLPMYRKRVKAALALA